jgi:hypothetical protein
MSSIEIRFLKYGLISRIYLSSIIRDGDTFHGISVESRGVFTDKRGRTYAGQCRAGYACGLGVLTWSDGNKDYAEHGPDGQYDGRWLKRFADGDIYYTLYERGGESKESAVVFADGRCTYNYVACAPDDPRLLALIAQVAPVEVRPAAQAPHPLLGPPLTPKQSSDGSAGSFCPPQALAQTVATEVHPHAARCRWWPCDTAQPSIALQRTTIQ